MSINSSDNIQAASSRIFNDYSVSEGNSRSLDQENQIRRAQEQFNDVENFETYSFNKPYKIPLKVVRSKVSNVHNKIQEVYDIFEDLLSRVYINPYLDPDMEECHIEMWKELNKNYPEVLASIENTDEEEYYTGGSKYFNERTGEYNYTDFKDIKPPNFISYKQYLHAERHGCRVCRKFVKEYDKLISHSVFVHLFDFRYYLNLLLHESHCIKESLLYDFGAEYEDESQEQVAVFYFSWAKMAENHTRLITEQLNPQADKLPASEVDTVTKKQAAQFQAFFSIRVAAYTEAIDNILFSVKKYLVDTCDIFYKKHVSPALKFKSQVAAPLELDLFTSTMRSSLPMLSEEVVTAVNAFRGNFGAILTDMMQRRNNTQQKFDNLLSLNIQRRKYISYIDQLAPKASSRPKIVLTITEDEYSKIFDMLTFDPSERLSLASGHGNLDNLNSDDHPQYLLRSGGTIFGDIIVEDGVTIDGVDISEHAHTGADGSVRIKSTDIDYQSVRDETTLLQTADGNLIEVSVGAFESDIRTGGVPVVNAIVSINVPDGEENKYEYEIIYLET